MFRLVRNYHSFCNTVNYTMEETFDCYLKKNCKDATGMEESLYCIGISCCTDHYYIYINPKNTSKINSKQRCNIFYMFVLPL